MSWWDILMLSEESKDTFTGLENHWRKLFAWGIKEKIPSQRSNWEAWEKFEAEWLADKPDVTQLQAQASGLRAAELAAMEKGFESKAKEVSAPDIEKATKPLEAAAAIDQGAAVATAAAKDVAKDLAKEAGGAASSGLGALWRSLPTWGKGAVIVTGVTVVASTVSNAADALKPRRDRR